MELGVRWQELEMTGLGSGGCVEKEGEKQSRPVRNAVACQGTRESKEISKCKHEQVTEYLVAA